MIRESDSWRPGTQYRLNGQIAELVRCVTALEEKVEALHACRPNRTHDGENSGRRGHDEVVQ